MSIILVNFIDDKKWECPKMLNALVNRLLALEPDDLIINQYKYTFIINLYINFE